MFRIIMTTGLLFIVVKFRQPCGQAVSQMIAGFDEQETGPASGPAATPVAVPPAGKPVLGPNGETFIEITPSMSDKDIEKAFQELKAQAAARKASPDAAPEAPPPAPVP